MWHVATLTWRLENQAKKKKKKKKTAPLFTVLSVSYLKSTVQVVNITMLPSSMVQVVFRHGDFGTVKDRRLPTNDEFISR
jgi:predicted adenine nucleotide alpha hydrolase (AANH) superfamily ATPase